VDITNTRPNVEQDVKTPSGHKTLVGKSSKSTPSEYKSEEKSTAADVDYKIIESPPGFGLFDLGINATLNRQSPLYQYL
jgi:hypothetical protein